MTAARVDGILDGITVTDIYSLEDFVGVRVIDVRSYASEVTSMVYIGIPVARSLDRNIVPLGCRGDACHSSREEYQVLQHDDQLDTKTSKEHELHRSHCTEHQKLL